MWCRGGGAWEWLGAGLPSGEELSSWWAGAHRLQLLLQSVDDLVQPLRLLLPGLPEPRPVAEEVLHLGAEFLHLLLQLVHLLLHLLLQLMHLLLHLLLQLLLHLLLQLVHLLLSGLHKVRERVLTEPKALRYQVCA